MEDSWVELTLAKLWGPKSLLFFSLFLYVALSHKILTSSIICIVSLLGVDMTEKGADN